MGAKERDNYTTMSRPSLRWRFAQIKDNTIYTGKLIIKNISPLIGSFLLTIAGRPVNKIGYKKRMLILFAGGIGDVAKRSIVCGYLHEYLSEYDIYHLMPYDITLPYAKKTIHFDYKRSKVDPKYYFSLINSLRNIGFSEVVVLLPAWEGFLVSLGKDICPDRVFRYVEVPPKEFLGVATIFARWFQPHRKVFVDIPLISYDDKRWEKKYWPSDVAQMVKFISKVINIINPAAILNNNGVLDFDAAHPDIVIDPKKEKSYITKLEYEYHTNLKNTALIGLGSSTATRNWSPKKFAEAAKHLAGRGLSIAIIDHPKDAKLVEEFTLAYGENFLNLGMDADIEQICILMKHAALVLSNDTSYVHLAVAMHAPSVCVFGGVPGANSCYGCKDLNAWVIGDNIEAVDVLEVNKTMERVLSYIRENGKTPAREFTSSYLESDLE